MYALNTITLILSMKLLERSITDKDFFLMQPLDSFQETFDRKYTLCLEYYNTNFEHDQIILDFFLQFEPTN